MERRLVAEFRAMRIELADTVRSMRSDMRLFLVGLLALAFFAAAMLASSRGVDPRTAAEAVERVWP